MGFIKLCIGISHRHTHTHKHHRQAEYLKMLSGSRKEEQSEQGARIGVNIVDANNAFIDDLLLLLHARWAVWIPSPTEMKAMKAKWNLNDRLTTPTQERRDRLSIAKRRNAERASVIKHSNAKSESGRTPYFRVSVVVLATTALGLLILVLYMKMCERKPSSACKVD